MLFEQRLDTPVVSAAWQPLRDLFLSGKSGAAWELATSQQGCGRPTQASEAILLLEIARACGAYRKAFALGRYTHSNFPDNFHAQLYYGRTLVSLNRHWPAIEYLSGQRPRGDEVPYAEVDWLVQLASLHGDAGFDATCRRLLKEAEALDGSERPFALYTRAGAHHGMRDWKVATELLAQCVQSAPGWARARAFYINCLLSQNEHDHAAEQIESALRSGCEDVSILLTGAMLAFSKGEFSSAEPMFRDLLNRWPQSDAITWVRRSLFILLVELGRVEEARELAAGDEEKLAVPKLKDNVSAKHAFIPLPLIAQNKNECVPTCVAMAMWPHGVRLDPSVVFQEMKGRDGVALWRMRRWGRQHGCVVTPVTLTVPAIHAMIDRQIPLIGVLEGAFSSHVDVVCGYHEDLDTLYVRDPVHWAPVAYPSEMALSRYQLNGGLLAFIPESDEQSQAVAQSFVSNDCQRLLDLSEAVAEGKIAEAEAAFADIDDSSPVSFLRDLYGRNVVISPDAAAKRMIALTADEDANPVARFRALLMLDTSDAQKQLEQLLEREQERLGYAGMRYLHLLSAMHDGRWADALRLSEQMLQRSGAVSEIWNMRSDILSELGDHSGSVRSMQLALEIDPLRLPLLLKSLHQRINQLNYTEYLTEFEQLMQRFPEERHFLWGYALALLDGPDGAAYETSVDEYLRWFPRDPAPYYQKHQWLQHQSRSDLSDAWIDRARGVMPDLFPEPASEQSPTEASDESASSNEGDQSNEPSESELPESIPDLIDLIWKPSDTRRDAALERLVELERSGRLTWTDRARLLANQSIISSGNTITDPQEVEKLLPTQPPGAAHWFANTYLDIVTNFDISIGTAKVILKWVDQVVPGYESFVELWFNRIVLLEKTHETEQALVELEKLLEKYPAYSSALYRMGVVRYQNQDFGSARKHTRRALEVNPGLPGAMQLLRSISQATGDNAGILEAISMLRRKYPYDYSLFRDEVEWVCEHRSPAAARTRLETDGKPYLPAQIQLLGGQIDLLAKNLPGAQTCLDQFELPADASEGLIEDWLQLRMSVAMQSEDDQAILAVCDEGLKHWPDSTRLKEIRAETLAATSPAEAGDLLSDVIVAGDPSARTAWLYLSLNQQDPLAAAKAVIDSAPEDRRANIVNKFAEVMEQAEYLSWSGDFLRWACDRDPESDELLWRLALHYNVAGNPKQAVIAAEKLYQRNPDNYEAARTLGRCLIDTDAHRALTILEDVCNRNRSADYLFDLARCYQIAGKHKKSIQTHWKVLEQNPYLSASWTNLALQSQPATKLWPYVESILERGACSEDEYTLVAMVDVARKVRSPLPSRWWNHALVRWQILQVHPGFRDEKSRLRRAIQAWMTVRPHEQPAQPVVSLNFLVKLDVRFNWPGVRWVPRSKELS